jgi:hypothetical protein
MAAVSSRGGWFRSLSEDRVLGGQHRSGLLSVKLLQLFLLTSLLTSISSLLASGRLEAAVEA